MEMSSAGLVPGEMDVSHVPWQVRGWETVGPLWDECVDVLRIFL